MHHLIHIHLGLREVKTLPVSVLVLVIYLLHLVAFSIIGMKLFTVRFTSATAYFSYGIFGYAVLGFYIWTAGYLSLLNRTFFVVSTCFWGAVGAVLIRKRLRLSRATQVAQSVMTSIRAKPLYVLGGGLLLIVVIVSGMRGIAFDDDYRWQTANYWGATGHWVKVPYRLTNGTAMSEMLHVPAAVFQSLTAAHWASTGIWVCCALSAAALASLLGVPTAVAVIAVLSIPVFTMAASTLNSDIPAVAFALAAFVFLLRHGEIGTPRRAVLPAGILFAAVLSCKFIVLACVPAAILVCLRPNGLSLSHRVGNGALLIAPILLTGLLWMAHTNHLIGHPFDPSGKHMARTPDDPMWLDGEAAGRIPSLHDLLRLPIEPLLTTLWGQEEPFGGRTGLLWLALLPATFFLAMTKRIPRSMFVGFLRAALSFYFLLAPIVLKTRFLLFFFICMALLSAAAYAHRRLLPRWAAAAVTLLFIGTAGLGILDGTRKLLMNVIIDTPPARHGPRVI